MRMRINNGETRRKLLISLDLSCIQKIPLSGYIKELFTEDEIDENFKKKSFGRKYKSVPFSSSITNIPFSLNKNLF
jgi:hypothetical protein